MSRITAGRHEEARMKAIRRERPEDFMRALAGQPDDINVVVQFGDA